jgi:ABC-type glycerol-3-phosphate transport system substrate-binding protein
MRKQWEVILVFTLVFFIMSTIIAFGAGKKDEDIEPAEMKVMTLQESRRQYEGTKLNILMSAGLQTAPVVELQTWFEDITGIDLNIEVYDETTTREKAVLDYTSHTGYYDALMTQDYFFDEFYTAGWFEPLDKYIENMSDPEWLNLNDLPETSLEYFTKEGQLYALPFTLLGGVLFYNGELFEKHNMQPPQTIEEMEDILEKLKVIEPDVYGIAARASKTFDAFGASIGFAYAYGGKILGEDYKVQCDSQEMISGISKFVELLQNYGPPDQAAMSWPETLPLFMNGKVAMMIEVSHCGGVFEDPESCVIAGNVGYSLPPKGPNGHIQWTYIDGFMINKDSKNKEATWLFMQWRSSYENNMREVADNLRYDVTSEGVLNSGRYKDILTNLGISYYADILKRAHAVATTEHLPRIPEFVQIAESFQSNVSLAVAGEVSVEEAMQNANREITQILDNAGY